MVHVPFTINAHPFTDAWKLPPSHNVYNAPQHLLGKQPLTDFHDVSVTFTGNYIHQYDQAGLLLTMTRKGHQPKWIKTGIEFYEGSPRLSTVCTDNWSDWSVAPAPSPKDIQTGKKSVTIQVEKEVGDDGSLYLWVNYLDELEKKTQLRQIGWVFGNCGGEGWDLNLAAVAARPEKNAHDDFHSRFSAVNVNGKKYTSG